MATVTNKTDAAVEALVNRYIDAMSFKYCRHCSLFYFTLLLKTQQNRYVGMATYQCVLKMMLDSGRYVGLSPISVGEENSLTNH